MKYNPDIHRRRSIRLKDYDYSQAGAYFVTICTKDRECLFGEIKDEEMHLNDAGNIIQKTWDELALKDADIELDEFVIMPNHVHGCIFIRAKEIIPVGAIPELPLQQDATVEQRLRRRKMLLPKIIGRFKMNSSRKINEIRNTPGIPVWQRNYYEHIVRNETELNTIREYIVNNPLNWQTDENYRSNEDNTRHIPVIA